MRTYATVRGTFWVRGSGKKLRGNPEAQVLAMYLMTCCQGTLCGLFSIALPTIAHETGLALDRLPELFADIGEIAKYDPEEELCWVPNAAREQIGEMMAPKDKRRGGLLRELKQFEGHVFHREFIQLYWEAYALEKPSPSQALTVDDACPLEGASEGEPLSLPAPGLGQGQGLGHDQVTGGAGGDARETLPSAGRVPCPPDLELTAAERAQLALSPGIPAEAIDRATPILRAKFTSGDPRTSEQWRRSLVSALVRDWSDPKKRAEMLGKAPAPRPGSRSGPTNRAQATQDALQARIDRMRSEEETGT